MRLNAITLFIFVALALTIVPAAIALTGSMGNARMILTTEVEEGKVTVIDRTILVNNVNDVPIKIAIEPEDHFKLITEVYDKEFVLQPGESKKAAFRISLTSGGTYNGKLLVSFTSAEPTIQEAPVGLASTIVIKAEGPVTQDYYDVVNYVSPTEEEVREERKVDPNENNEESSNSNANENNDKDPEVKKVGTSVDREDKNTSSPISMTGILIVAAIVIVGVLLLLVLLVILKKLK